MWPCRDTMKHISHVGCSPLEGLALVSGVYRNALMYPRLASMPSLEIIHPSTPPKLIASWLASWIPTILLFFCVAGAFLTPVGAVNRLFRSEGSVSNHTKPLEFVEIHSSAQRRFSSMAACQHGSSNWRTVSLPAASHHSHRPGMTWQNMRGNVAQYVSPAAIPVHKIWYTFERISSVWLSLLIIGWTWRSGAERGSPRCEMIRLGQS